MRQLVPVSVNANGNSGRRKGMDGMDARHISDCLPAWLTCRIEELRAAAIEGASPLKSDGIEIFGVAGIESTDAKAPVSCAGVAREEYLRAGDREVGVKFGGAQSLRLVTERAIPQGLPTARGDAQTIPRGTAPLRAARPLLTLVVCNG